MTDREKNDHWGELADTVGATPQPKDVPAERTDGEIGDANGEDIAESLSGRGVPDSNTTDESADGAGKIIEVGEVSTRKVRAYRPKSGWDELATEFDLPIPKTPSSETPSSETPAAVEEKSHVEIEAEEPPQVISALDEVAVDHSLDAGEQIEDESPWLGVDQFDALFDDSHPGDRREGAGRSSEGPSFEEAIREASKEIENERVDEDHTGGRRRKKRRRRPRKMEPDAVKHSDEKSDKDKAPTQSGAEDTIGFGAGLFGDVETPRDASRVFLPDEEVDDASEVLEISADIFDEESSEGEESGRKRGRRRRRRGSSKKKEADVERAVDEGLVSEVAVGKDGADEEPADKAGRRGSSKKHGSADREDDDTVRRGRKKDDSENDEDRAISHRGIPSWDEAVEHIIATNLENRSKKSGGDASPRSRGGRSRGGRDKSGSRKRSG